MKSVRPFAFWHGSRPINFFDLMFHFFWGGMNIEHPYSYVFFLPVVSQSTQNPTYGYLWNYNHMKITMSAWWFGTCLTVSIYWE